MIINDYKQFLLLIKNNKFYKIIGLDVGSKTIGIAIYNSVTALAIPSSTIKRSSMERDMKLLTDIISSNKIIGAVIGLPIEMNGNLGKGAEFAKQFAVDLDLAINDLNITFYDERLTSALANKLLKEAKVSRRIRNKVDNEVAASIILDDLMKQLNHV